MKASIDGTDVDYELAGRKGPAVLLVHGLGSRPALWWAQVKYLAGFCRVVNVGLRGHGGEPLAGPVTVAALASDAAGVCRHLGIERYCVVAASFGSAVGFELAATWPEAVQGLVAIGPRARLGPLRQRLTRETIALVRTKGVGALADLMADAGLGPRTASAVPTLRELFRAASAALPAETWERYLTLVADHDSTAAIRRLSCPTLLVRGAVDQLTDLEELAALRRLLPKAAVRVVPGAGHDVPIDAAEHVNALIAEFLVERLAEQPGVD